MMHLDFTKPETLHKIAALPHYGWAENIIRMIDPYWHAPEGPYHYKVDLVDGEEEDECPTCGCDCGSYHREPCRTSAWVEAASEDEARKIAETDHPGWFVRYVHPPKFPTAEVPAEYLAWFEAEAA